jgi:tetratricopeptide (TPR) repeat protein
MYTQIFKDILLKMKYDDKSIREFITFCRNNNFGSLKNIELFEREYHNKSAIWWYTWPAFIYSVLNYALRTLEADIIIKMGFFICDLHHQIQQLYQEQVFSYDGKSFNVYRGQGLSKEDFEKLVKAKGGLISFNNFLSTSKNQEVSLSFAHSASIAANMVGILFVMSIDPSVSSAPFACIEQLSFLEAEAEILFSMHTVFRISDIKQINSDNQVYQVELQLTTDDDKQLRTLTNWFAEDVQDDIGWKRLGSLLLKIGQFEKAEDFYNAILEHTSNDRDKIHYYHQLAFIKHHKGDFKMSHWYHLKINELEKKTSSIFFDLIDSNNDIGVDFINPDENNKGISFYSTKSTIDPEEFLASTVEIRVISNDMETTPDSLLGYEKAVEAFEKSFPSNHCHSVTSCNYIDRVDDALKKSSPIIWFNRKLLEIRQKHLPENHPDIARSYGTVASLYSEREEYSQACSFYQKSIEIYEKILPSNHPILATCYNNIGMMYFYTGEYSIALGFLEKTLQITEKVLPPNHPDLSFAYENIAGIYKKMKNYSKAVFFYKKQLKINEKILHTNDERLISSYLNVGKIYRTMEQYSEALSFFEKALEIRQQLLPSDDLGLADNYGSIGLLYSKMEENENALLYYNKCVEICENRLPSDDHRLTFCYDNIAKQHENNENYSQAIVFYEKVLEQTREVFPSNHPNLSACYNNIALVYIKMEEYSKALFYLEQALSIMKTCVPADEQNLQTVQNYIDFLKEITP